MEPKDAENNSSNPVDSYVETQAGQAANPQQQDQSLPAAVDPPESTQSLRSLLLKVMLGCVISAAAVAVTAVLAGNMGDVGWKAIRTVLSAMLHTALLFGVVSTTETKNPLLVRSTNMVINTSMVIAVLSFFTSVLGIWGVMDGAVSARLYATYIVVLFLVLHAKSLMDVNIQFEKVRPYVVANYFFMFLVAALILGAVYAPDGSNILSGFYGRLLAAAAIIDVTLSIVVIGMYRLFIQKHPELEHREETALRSGGHSWLKIVLLILFFFFFVGPFIITLVLRSAFGSY